MHTIHLTELTGYTNKDIYDYLLSHNETSFRIIVKRNFRAPEHDILEIANEYFNAIYFGQTLLEISHDFSYNVPSENSSLPFIFEFRAVNKEMLAFLLFHFTRGLVPEPDITALRNKYREAKETYLNQYLNGRICPGCHGLIFKLDYVLDYDRRKL